MIQARMGSTRLPGKVLADLAGQPMLVRVVNRARKARLVDDLMVLTTDNPRDDVLVELCSTRDIPWFRGSEHDVLDRYHAAMHAAAAEVVVRITSDCPLVAPELIDAVVGRLSDTASDYVSNIATRTYPRGLDVEALTRHALETAWRDATEPHQREHVTPYLLEHPDLFAISSVHNDRDLSNHRWTVDTPEDLSLVRAIFERLGPGDDFTWHEVVRLLDREPELADLNRHIEQKPVRET